MAAPSSLAMRSTGAPWSARVVYPRGMSFQDLRGRRLVEHIAALLDAAGDYVDREPVKRAADLALPDGTPVGESLRAWAAFDNRYPTLRSAWRGEQPIADAEGRLLL